MSISHPGVKQGVWKIDMVERLSCTKTANHAFNLEQLLIFNRLLLMLSIIIKESPHRLQSITIDFLNIASSALGWEVTNRCVRACVCVCVCVCVCMHVLTQCAKSGRCVCSIHAKCGPSTKSGHTWGPLLVLTSDSDSSPLKSQELTIKLWGSPSPFLALKLFLESFYIWMKVRF